MADTFTPVSGYLAGIYRSLGAVIGATEKHQLLLNPDFETGDLTSWTDDSAGGASTAVATALKGWKERSWGVVLDDDGSNLAGIHQDVTLATAITAAQALTHRIIASCWARFDAVDDTATLKVTGTLNTGAVATVEAVPTAAGTGYVVDEVLTITTGSGDATVKVTAETGGVIDTVELVATGTSGYSVAAGQATTASLSGADATIEIATITATTYDGSVTMLSAHPFYDDGVTLYGADGYFSVAIDALENTVDIKVEVYSPGSAAQVLNIDNVHLAVIEQVAGAFGQVAMPIGHDYEESTTFASAGTAGWRSYVAVLIKQGALTFPSFWVQEESMAHEQSTEDELYVVLWTQKATNTSDRFEFLGKVSGIEWAAPVGELQKGSVTIVANGLIGYAHI